MLARPPRQLELAGAFAGAASGYWLDVFPRLRREVHRWRERADSIPDPVLRRFALETLEGERGNLEGAAAFAVLAPAEERERVLCAVVAFQAVYDFADTLVEQPGRDAAARGRRLHGALLRALAPGSGHEDYLACELHRDDGGYVRALVDGCRQQLRKLPSYELATAAALRAAARMVSYQCLIHDERGAAAPELARWARSIAPTGAPLRWWETAAAGASSLGVFALIAAAARANVDARELALTERAYFPWVGALHVMLDSLADRAADELSGHHSLVGHYASTEEAADRLGAIATRSLSATASLAAGRRHELILAAMASFYLSSPGAATAPGLLVGARVGEALGAIARPSMAVLRLRRRAGRFRHRAARPASRAIPNDRIASVY
jgi:tetraprenyl-beta-curcumene synthase